MIKILIIMLVLTACQTSRLSNKAVFNGLPKNAIMVTIDHWEYEPGQSVSVRSDSLLQERFPSQEVLIVVTKVTSDDGKYVVYTFK